MKQITASVIDIKPIPQKSHRSGYRVLLSFHLIWLYCPQVAQEAKPGQFVMVRCGKECTLPRPFSIHQVNGNNIALFFAVWEDGKGTNWLSRRHIGDTVELLGPLGNSYSVQSTSHKLLLLAGGVGIAPLYFLAQEAQKRQCLITLLHGASKVAHLYPKDMPAGITLITATEDGSVGKKGLITDLLPDFINEADQVFACGPLGMYKDMSRRRNRLLKDKPTQVSMEVRMGCGLGVCYGCTVKTKHGLKQVCKDGPVFDLNDILWDELD